MDLTPQVQVLESKPHTYNEVKLSISAKTDQRSSKSGKKLDSVGQNISIQNLGFS